MADRLVAFGFDQSVPSSMPTNADVMSAFYTNNNLASLKSVFDKDYLLELLAVAGTHLERMAIVIKDLPGEVKDYFDESVRDRAVHILLSAGSVTAGYLVIRKLQQLYHKKQLRSKEIEETTKIEEDIEGQQKEVAYQRSLNPRGGKDKRELCILCVANRRECVFLDCGHICVCVDCLKSLPFPKTCPICRCKIIQTVLLFHA